MAREMKDSGIEWIGEIPKGWSLIPVKYLASYNDEVLGDSTDKDYEFEYIEIGSVQYGRGIIKTEHFCFKDAPSRARRIVRKDDIIISTVRTYLKAVAAMPEFESPHIASTGFVVIRPHSISPQFLNYAVLSEAFISAIESNSVGISYPAINATDVVRLKIPVPDIAEQHRIASFLDRKCAEIDSVIANTQRTIEEYKALKQSIITEAVTKGVRGERPMKDSGIEWLPVIPQEWISKRGKHLFVETNERSTDGHEELLTVSHITGITPRSMKNVNMFMSESLVDYKKCHIGDLAANTMWMWQGAIGVSKYEGVISPSYNTYRQRENAYCADYLDYLLRIPALVSTYAAFSTGITASRLRLYPNQFFSIIFPVPSLEEQEEIINYLSQKVLEMDKLIKRKEDLIVELESYKKSVIYEYVTGKKEAPIT